MEDSSPVVASVKRNEVAVFIALALLFSWAFWVPLEFGDVGSGALQFCLNNIGVLGPLFAAFEVLLITRGPEGIKSLAGGFIKWRAGTKWYIVALILPLAIEAMVLACAIAFTGMKISLNGSSPGDISTLIGQAYFAIVTATALFGYLLPRLIKSFSPLVSSLLAAAFFFIWHLPFVVVSVSNGRADYELWWALGNVGAFLLFTWIYRNARGSLMPLILFNLSLNYFRWAARGMMQATPVHDQYFLDFSIHLLAGVIVLLISWKYFLGKAPAAKAPGAMPGE